MTIVIIHELEVEIASLRAVQAELVAERRQRLIEIKVGAKR